MPAVAGLAGYRKARRTLSSKRALPSKHGSGRPRAYFGCTLGSPPGEPGGGITGILPPPGAGRFISGSRGSSPVRDDCTPADHDPDNGTSDYWVSLEMMEEGAIAVPDDVATSTASAEGPTFSSGTVSSARPRRRGPWRKVGGE